MTAGGGDRERLVHARNDKLAAERKRFQRGKLDRRAGKTNVRSAVTLWVAGGPAAHSALAGTKSDIAVAGELSPRPAFLADVVNRNPLAL